MRHGDHGGNADSRVPVQRFFDLDGGNVFPTRNNDILGSILELDVAIGVDHPQVAGVEPTAFKGLLGGLWIAEISLHHDVATKHDFAHGFAVAGHRSHGFGVENI